jgi:mannose-6-phosphate isomerase-like protein (cupin superfamily)
MAEAGRVTYNPVTDEHVKWLLTAADTDGALTRFEMRVRRPGGGMRTEHVHRRSEERFELLAGRLALVIAGDRHVLEAGDRAVVPAGVPHLWWNDGREEMVSVVEIDPPLRFEQMMETAFGLARDGRMKPDGRLGLLQMAVLLREFEDEVHVTSPPLWLQRALFGPLAALGRARGLRPVYARYSGPATDARS